MHGGKGCIYFCRHSFWHEINTPNILFVLVAFDKNGIQIVVNIFFEFLEIYFFNTSEMIMDELKMENRRKVIVYAPEWAKDTQRFFYGSLLSFQFGIFFSSVFSSVSIARTKERASSISGSCLESGS